MQCQDVDKSAWKRVGTRAVLEQRENTDTRTHKHTRVIVFQEVR